MRHLITGGAGFIGSHLAEALLERGDEVFVLDDLSTGSVENIRHLKAHARFHYFFDSITNKHLLAELVDESDIVFHLAAAVGVRLIVESPVRTIETNVYGTQLVLDAASKKKKMVFTASTSEVYGKSNQVPFKEDADLVLGPTTKGRWSYAASKALDEFLALSYWKEKKQPVIVARFFNTVGPRQTGRYGMVLPNFVRQALENSPITVYGTGQAIAVLLRRSRHDRGGFAVDRHRSCGGRGGQHRDRRRDFDRGAGAPGEEADEELFGGDVHSVRPGVRAGIRGYAAAHPVAREAAAAHVVPAYDAADGDRRPRGRAFSEEARGGLHTPSRSRDIGDCRAGITAGPGSIARTFMRYKFPIDRGPAIPSSYRPTEIVSWLTNRFRPVDHCSI